LGVGRSANNFSDKNRVTSHIIFPRQSFHLSD
jgi:hypothetical protein